MRNHLALIAILVLSFAALFAQNKSEPVYVSDNGDGTYTNPILYADYSDPDAIRVGDDYYMTASSFSHFPGLPILHSKDLINWTLIGHAAPAYPFPEFGKPQHGMAIWAPSIRFHNGEFFIYFGDPDRGVFVAKAKNAAGPWSPLKLIRKVTGWIDTCPFWDEDGNAYLVHAWANSRAGIKSILAVNRMTPDGMQILDDGVVVFVGHFNHPTIEGPKLYKRNGYYYIFAPAGGVKPGWQTVLRSRNIFGPYEDKIVLEQGITKVNGPHQGAWVQTQWGEDWFVHFQDRYAYGRIVHLQPMRWENDWPVIGVDHDKNGIGEPVLNWRKPEVGQTFPIVFPQTSDEFDSTDLGLQWQWQANGNANWYSLTQRPDWLRLCSQQWPSDSGSLWSTPSLLMQKLPAPAFVATAKLSVGGLNDGDVAGLVMFGLDYAFVGIQRTGSDLAIIRGECRNANKSQRESLHEVIHYEGDLAYLRLQVWPESDTAVVPIVKCSFQSSADGKQFRELGEPFTVREGLWVGAKMGLFASQRSGSAQGFVDVDWFRVEPYKDNSH